MVMLLCGVALFGSGASGAINLCTRIAESTSKILKSTPVDCQSKLSIDLALIMDEASGDCTPSTRLRIQLDSIKLRRDILEKC